jgi:hypothetical protein
MFDVRDLLQWERFIAPAAIRTFYTLAVILLVLAGLAGLASALQLLQFSPVAAVMMMVVSVIGAFAGILGIRIGCEFVLVTFRINDHLGAMRNRIEM